MWELVVADINRDDKVAELYDNIAGRAGFVYDGEEMTAVFEALKMEGYEISINGRKIEYQKAS